MVAETGGETAPDPLLTTQAEESSLAKNKKLEEKAPLPRVLLI